MRGQALSSAAGALLHRRLPTPSYSSSRRIFPLLSRCLSTWNNSSPQLTCKLASRTIKLKTAAEAVGRRRSRWFSAGASNVSDPGSIDSSMILSMQTKIKEQLEAESVVVKDAYGDGRHVSIVVVSKSFEGKSAVNRQRMVYKAIWEELQTTVHAVDHMTTLTPDEAPKS